MEVIPHFWVNEKIKNPSFIKTKNIKAIIFLSKTLNFYKHIEIEQIRIPVDVSDNSKNDNIVIYQHLFDVTNYIFEKIYNNKNILVIGNENDSSILYLIIITNKLFILYSFSTPSLLTQGSTIVNLISRFYDVQNGSIFIGNNIKECY